MTHVATSPANVSAEAALRARWHRMVRWVAGTAAIVGLFMAVHTLPLQHTMDRVTAWVESLGYVGMVAYTLLYILSAVLLMPGWPLTVAAGVAFGFVYGTILATVASTLGAAAAMLIARYVARDTVARLAHQYPRFGALDRAVQHGGWRIVALMRLSPITPYNLQNYFYGLTSIRFWPCTLVSAVAMIPGTAMLVYAGFLGFESLQLAAQHDATARLGSIATLSLGLIALLALTIYLTRLSQRALREQDKALDDDVPDPPSSPAETFSRSSGSARPLRISQRLLTGAIVLAAILAVVVGVTAQINQQLITRTITGLFGTPEVVLTETWADREGDASFDHAAFDRLLGRIVTDAGLVDYEALHEDPAALDDYIVDIADAPWADLNRDERLALLINAHNAFMLRLVIDHWPLARIDDLSDLRDHAIWQIGDEMTVSLNEIEHDLIRSNTIEPRIHWALNYMAVACPPMRNEAYTADRLDEQLEQQARIVHTDDSRWFRYDREEGVVWLIRHYDWYRADFEYVADSIVQYAARYHEPLRHAIEAGEYVRVDFLEYDWALNHAPQ